MLALFPLQSVVFPGERLPLHIFEDRYQQLIKDCEEDGINFGIPTFINNKLEYGTLVELKEVVNRYEDGPSDVICNGIKVFKVNTFYETMPGKLYAGGEVTFQENIEDGTPDKQAHFYELILKLYQALELPKPAIEVNELTSFSLSHKIGLSLEQEYKLLSITSEAVRIDFLIHHLIVVIPMIKQLNRMKEVIQMNGHFKNFDPLDFKEFKV
ncbi:LON peptidase substrate-binding domain-containing protein [Gangjinia marincola]|uniref:LON peptidase substrate-binding domain-containing protein n=1 Tax=Gangjinia marincola TaxID=578463 RepID=A0ABN1MGW8_9FLAO